MTYDKLEVDFGIWGTIKKIAVIFAVLGLLTCLALWYVPIFNQTVALQKEIDLKREALRKQQELHQKYMEEIVALRTDPETVEHAVREKLGLVKPNETIYHFESPKQNQ